MRTPDRPVLLVVDDDRLVRWSARTALKDVARVRVAPSAERAIATLGGPAKVDGLLVDVRLPGMDGLELIRRARELRPALKIFLMTGFDLQRAPHDAFALRADAYLPKPFDLDLLRNMVSSHL